MGKFVGWTYVSGVNTPDWQLWLNIEWWFMLLWLCHWVRPVSSQCAFSQDLSIIGSFPTVHCIHVMLWFSVLISAWFRESNDWRRDWTGQTLKYKESYINKIYCNWVPPLPRPGMRGEVRSSIFVLTSTTITTIFMVIMWCCSAYWRMEKFMYICNWQLRLCWSGGEGGRGGAIRSHTTSPG